MSNHHRNYHLRWLIAALVALTFQLGCADAPLTPKTPPDAVAAHKATRPTIVRVDGALWVVGLPPNHGWTLGKRVLLTKHDNDKGLDLKVGVVTILDDGYTTAAPVGIVYEEPGQSFDGVRAEIVKGDQRIRLGRGFGRLTAPPNMGTVEIDLGQQDGVAIGDVYEVRSAAGTKSVGRVKISEVGPATSKASVLNRAAFTIGLEVVYQPRSDGDDQSSLLRILVCDFAPKADEKEVVLAGKRFAGELATHLREASESWSGLTVVQASQLVANDNEARALGKAYPADIVVWGTAMCVESQGCALPVFTVVDPERLAMGRMAGRDVMFDVMDPGRSIERGTASDPAGLAFGLLGELTYQAQRFGDAAFYLERVPQGSLERDDGYRAYRDLSNAQYLLGRVESALGTAAKLEFEARGKSRGWEMAGVGQRARILYRMGAEDDALALFQTAATAFDDLHARAPHAAALGGIARILGGRGQVDEALKLHRHRLSVFEAVGDQPSRAVVLGDIARIMVNKGEIDEALRMYREELAVFESLGDQRSRATALVEIARILANKGEVEQALKLYHEALDVYATAGERRSHAVTMTEVGRVLLATGQVDDALKLFREAATNFGQQHDRRSRAVVLGDIARILSAQGNVDEALKLHREELKVYDELGDRRSRAATLNDVAQIQIERNQIHVALPLLLESYEIVLGQGDAYGIGFVGERLGRALVQSDRAQEAKPILEQAAAAFVKIGKPDKAAAVRRLLAEFSGSPSGLSQDPTPQPSRGP